MMGLIAEEAGIEYKTGAEDEPDVDMQSQGVTLAAQKAMERGTMEDQPVPMEEETEPLPVSSPPTTGLMGRGVM